MNSFSGETPPIVNTDPAAIEELTTRAVAEIYPSPEALTDALSQGRQLTAYMGIDPTAPDMHVGHESQLWKLRRLQDLGHRVILLIGDFTAMIGDPTDKSAARVKLTREEVLANAASYKEQAGKILDFNREDNPIELRYNSEWLGKMGFADVLELASQFTTQQLLERDMFRKRMAAQKPLGMHELMYPMMQGWDSVAMEVDIEVGGSDQIFNMLAGSTLVQRHLKKPKFVIAGQLLVDPSGKKIGKTEGNMITLNDTPLDMFHKIMLWGDGITPHALELCSQMPMTQIQDIARKLQNGELSGLDGKLLLAKTIVTDLHGAEAASQAGDEYRRLTARGQGELDPMSLMPAEVSAGQDIISVLRSSGLAPSNNKARELVTSGAVRVNGVKVDDTWTVPVDKAAVVLRVGKMKHENHRRLVIGENETA